MPDTDIQFTWHVNVFALLNSGQIL